MASIAHAVSATYLIHFFGPGLSDDRYVVERFRSMANGDIRRIVDGAKKHAVATKETVQGLRPNRNEIIVCTGLSRKGGMQVWGDLATGLFHERRMKG